MKGITILANDPSLTGWGYAVIRNGTIIDADCIKTVPEHKKRRIRVGDDTVRRIKEINAFLLDVMERLEVNYIAAELPHGSQSAVGAKMIGIVTAIIQTIGDCKNIPIEWYSEADAKKALCGKNSLSKSETINRIHAKYKVPFYNIKYKDEAIADAMAIYHVARKQSTTLKMLE